MKNIKNFQQFNESISVGTVLLGGAALWFLYKFLKGVSKSIKYNKQVKNSINSIINHLKNYKTNMKDKIGISEFNDRYFIRLQTPFEPIDFRILKDTKQLIVSDNTYQLSDEQYEDFMKVVENQ